MKKINVINFTVSFSLLALIIYKIGLIRMIDSFRQINPVYFLIIIPLQMSIVFLKGVALFVLLSCLGKIRFRDIIKHYLFCWMAGLFVPGKMGQLLMIPLMKGTDVSTGETSAVLVLDKLISTFVLLFMSLIAIVFVFPDENLLMTLSIGILIFLLCSLCAINLSVRKFFRKFILGKYAGEFTGYYKTLVLLIRKKAGHVIMNMSIYFLRVLITSLSVYYLFQAFGGYVEYHNILCITPIGQVIAFVPVTLNGIGVREGTVLLLYRFYDVASVIVINVCLIQLIMDYLLGVAVFLGLRNYVIEIQKQFKELWSRSEGVIPK